MFSQTEVVPVSELDHSLVVDDLRKLVLKSSENRNIQYKIL